MKCLKIADTDSLIETTLEDYDWLQITDPTLGDLALVKQKTGINPSTIKLVLTSHESNRIVGLNDNGRPLVIVVQYPIEIKSKLGPYKEYTTSPIICIINREKDSSTIKNIITISNDEPSFIKKIRDDTDNLKISVSHKRDIILLILYYIARDFHAILSLLSANAEDLEVALKKATSNDVLYHIMSIQKTIASLFDSVKDNTEICNKIIDDSTYFKAEKYTQLAVLARVELTEATELADFLDYLLEKYANLISSIVQNNQSVMMNTFTRWNTILTFIGVVFGGLGINYWLPDEGLKWAFLIILAVVAILALLLNKHISKLLDLK